MTRAIAWLTISRIGAGMAFMAWASALPWILSEWRLPAAQAGWVQTSFNLAYAASLLTSGWLSDRFGAAVVLRTSSWASVVLLGLCAAFARDFGSALVLFSLLALGLGGSYAPALMLASADPARRGLAVGWVLTGASVGYVLIIAVSGAAYPAFGVGGGWLTLLWALSGSAVCAELALRGWTGTSRSPRTVPGPSLKALRAAVTSRTSILLTTGYALHCWELLGMWAWTPTFLSFVLARHGLEPLAIGLLAALSIHLSGAVSTLAGGWASDRYGRRSVLVGVGIAGAVCSFGFGWLGQAGAATAVCAAALYGGLVLADSGVLTAAMADAVPEPLLGRMLALRSLVGFGLGALSPAVVGVVLDAAGRSPSGVGWGLGFSVLGLGGLGAAICARALPRSRSAQTIGS
ncbi:MAG: MFS transporter [Brevundimonas sp.]